jgi:two-component system, cell cycle response regulator DivK
MAAVQILVVEDHDLQSKLVRFLLQEAGHTVRTAASAEEAREILRSFFPDLILMDLQLPGMDGLELTRLLRLDPVHAATPIIALTAYTDPSDLQKAREAGCNGKISKPIDTATFARRIGRFLNLNQRLLCRCSVRQP